MDDPLESEQPLPLLVAERARSSPDQPYLEETTGRVATYGWVDETGRRWAAALRRVGVGAGDTVLSMVDPSVDAICSWLGVAWLRAIDVGVNTQYRGRMLGYVLRDSGARVLIISSRYVDRLAELGDDAAQLELVVVTGTLPEHHDLPCPVVKYDELLDEPLGDLERPARHDISCMMYTSGTTGPSKGVLVPWAQLSATIPAQWTTGQGADEAQYAPFPMYHVGGKAPPYLMARHGGRVILRDHFALDAFWDDVRTFRATFTILAGGLPQLLLKQPPRPDDADNPLQMVLMVPVVAEYEEFERRFGVSVVTGYNMTEISTPLIFAEGIPDWSSCGRVRQGYPHYEVRVVDANDYPVAPGEIGELVVRTGSPWTLNAGYFGKAEQTAAAWRNGWFHTGDAFRYDEGGNYYFVDRMKDTIRRRGENISSFEVEALVSRHDSVLECAAIGVPAELGEEEVKVVVVPRAGEVLDPVELVSALARTMPAFMVPRYVEVVDALPKTEATQRVKKTELRVNPLNERTWDRKAAGVDARA